MALKLLETNITLDLYDHDGTRPSIKSIALDDNTRYVFAKLTYKQELYDIGSDATVKLIIIRPDKVGAQIAGESKEIRIGQADESIVTVYGAYAELDQPAIAVAGTLLGQFIITSGDQVLRSQIFTDNNGQALDADTWAGQYDGYNLDELVEKVDNAVEKVDGMEAEVNELKSGFSDLYNSAYVTDSASGAVAHFTDGADDVPMKSLTVNIEPVQSGSGDPSPSNVRAISGWDAVKVTRAGKNLIPKYVINPPLYNGVTFTVNPDGSVSANGTASATCNASSADISGIGGEVTLSGCPSDGSATTYQLWIYDKTTGSSTAIVDTGNGSTGTLNKDHVYSVRIRIQSGYTVDKTFYPMLRLASDVDDTYEPYNGNTYDISLASAGTVYGGTLDVVSGELTMDRKYELFDGSSDETWQYLTGSFGNRCAVVRNDVLNTGSRVKVDANEGLYSANANTVGTVFASGVSIYYYPPATVTTLEEYKSWLSSNPLQVVYPLATPLTYQLSATEIKSLLGINNVWSNAGDMDVEYRADTKLYIKRLTDSDTDMIADANITSGQYFMVGNDLYRATVNIASGARIVIGTNATKVSLSEALNEINA